MVCYDLDESNYTFNYDSLTFYFSSEFNLNRFEKIYNQYLKTETLKLQSKYKAIIESDGLLLLQLYKKIEKRGFKVMLKGEQIPLDYIISLKIII